MGLKLLSSFFRLISINIAYTRADSALEFGGSREKRIGAKCVLSALFINGNCVGRLAPRILQRRNSVRSSFLVLIAAGERHRE